MRTVILPILIVGVLSACNEIKKESKLWPSVQPPVAEVKPHWRVIHNDSTLDNYYWMYDYFGKGPDSATVIDYLKAENTYLDTMMSGTRELQEVLFQEMKDRIKEKDEDAPVFYNGYYYYKRTDDGAQYFKYCRKKASLDAPEEILLDIDKMAEGHSYYAAKGFNVSDDNKLLAFAIDDKSRRQYTIHIKDLTTGKLYKDAIKNTSGDPCWANDNKTIFYSSNNKVTLLSEKIKRHTIGTDTLKDVVVYEEKDNTNYIFVKRSKNKKYIFITSESKVSSEVLFIEADKPPSSFKSFQPRMKDVLYSVFPLTDRFLIRTNKDAQNFKLVECLLEKTGVENWKDFIPHRDDVLVEGVEEFQDFIVMSERKEGLVQLNIRRLKDENEHYVDFGEPTYTASIDANPEFTSGQFRYNYSSLTTPFSVYDYDLTTHEKKLVKQQEVIGGHSPSDYITERLNARARDNTKVPISIVYKKGFKKDGHTPCLIVGYGSYGISSDAYFSSSLLSLLNRGFVYAIAHVRGGQEMGRQWYEDGKMLRKKNTFTDFIDCSEFLVQERYTSKEHLYAMGGSAGGLLMGAIVNMNPDLWHGVIAVVPFVDVVNTMLDESIPLTTLEFNEWGNPKNKDAYVYMKSYSPYENVEKKNYPNLLVTTGLHDSQVQYFEPAKWVAKLRTMKTDQNILLFQTNMDYGHGGASGRFDYLKGIALRYAFLLSLEGMKSPNETATASLK